MRSRYRVGDERGDRHDSNPCVAATTIPGCAPARSSTLMPSAIVPRVEITSSRRDAVTRARLPRGPSRVFLRRAYSVAVCNRPLVCHGPRLDEFRTALMLCLECPLRRVMPANATVVIRPRGPSRRRGITRGPARCKARLYALPRGRRSRRHAFTRFRDPLS
jgi:hypothetical protein